MYNTCQAWRGRRSKTSFPKVGGNAFPGFPLKAMSHADIICCAFTEICPAKNSVDQPKTSNNALISK
jgi:hypothetical protein